MKIGAILCSCGGQLTDKIDFSKLKKLITDKVSWIRIEHFLCAEDRRKRIINFIKRKKPDAVIFLACSPLNKEETLKGIAIQSRVNPYMVNIVNVREQVAWVTENKQDALKKTYALFIGALQRLKHQKPLFDKTIPISDDVLVVGGGIAGIKAAVTFSKIGKKVYLLEKEKSLGGRVTNYEKIFPDLSCGPCFVHPLVSELLDSNIELLLNSEIIDIKGSYGNIVAKVRINPIYVDPKRCIGCRFCESVCPVGAVRVSSMKIPTIAVIDSDKCLRFRENDCLKCIKECPVTDTIDFSQKQREIVLKVGTVLWATGFGVVDCKIFPNLGYGRIRDVYDASEFEEILNSEGPKKGELITEEGRQPRTIAIIHCVGSLDERYYSYCSKICCQYAFKFNRLIRQRLPEAEIIHFVKEVVIPGSDAYRIYCQVKNDPFTKFYRYNTIDEFTVCKDDSLRIIFKDESINSDMIVLCPAMVCQEHPKISGVFPIGSVKEPMSIKETILDTMAQVAEILVDFKKNKTIVRKPTVAKIDYTKCSLCGICISQCPYKAIEIDEGRIKILDIICEGCGICVACCPAEAIDLEGYRRQQILSEIEGIIKGCEEVERWQL